MRRVFELEAKSDERSDSPEEIAAFEERLREFWDIVSMCSTSQKDDLLTHTYQSGAMPKPLNRWGFWCPIAESQQELVNWMDYNPRVREAIRRSFRRGIGRLTDWDRPEILENWLSYEPGLMYKIPPYIDIISDKAERTGQYALALARIQLLLRDIYQEAKYIPYHPDFDRSFKNKLVQISLNNTSDFIKQLCLQPYNREMLENSEGRAYLRDLITEVAETTWLNHSSKTQRAYEALTEDSGLTTHSNNPSATLLTVTNNSNITDSPWITLLRSSMNLDLLFLFFEKFGLLDAQGRLTPLGSGTGLGKASKAPWAGALHALITAKLLSDNIALVCRVLESAEGKVGIKINSGTVRNISKQAQTKYLGKAKDVLRELKLLS